jgi:multiple sugar transport system permease protein
MTDVSTLSQGHRQRRTLFRTLTILVLGIYSVLTIAPFYFLFIRSFVPTVESTKFYGWIPRNKEFDLNSRFGNMATFYNLNLTKFKKDMGISGIIDMNFTLREVAEKYAIPGERMRSYFQPYYLLNGWYNVLSSNDFYKSFIATTLVTLISIILGTILGSATGFGLCRFRRRWQTAVYTLYLLQMVVPGVITMLPSYIIVRTLGLTNTYTILVLTAISGGALSAMIFTGAAAGIPREMQESVMIDGGGPLRYYRSILLPLIKPAIGAYCIITIPQIWNSLLGSLLFNKPGKYLLMAFINSFSGTYSTNYQAIYAGLAIALLPILVLYVCLKNLFVRAALMGAIKG